MSVIPSVAPQRSEHNVSPRREERDPDKASDLNQFQSFLPESLRYCPIRRIERPIDSIPLESVFIRRRVFCAEEPALRSSEGTYAFECAAGLHYFLKCTYYSTKSGANYARNWHLRV